jgi:hypothetical protein
VKLLRAQLFSIRGLPDMICNFGDPSTGAAHPVVAITGPGGSGKTRLIEAILAAKEVLAPYGPIAVGEPWIRDGERAAKIELTFRLDDEECRASGLAQPVVKAEALFRPRACAREADEGFLSVLERYEHGPTGKLEYFPASRMLPPPGPAHGTSAIEQRLWRLPRDARKYGFVARFLAELPQSPERANRFAATLSSLCPWLTYSGVTGGDPLRCVSSRDRAPSRAHELSTAEADALLIAATATLIGLDRSIVFLDRPEISSDERNIATWAAALRGVGKDTQIVFATSSPALLQSMDARAVIEMGHAP